MLARQSTMIHLTALAVNPESLAFDFRLSSFDFTAEPFFTAPAPS